MQRILIATDFSTRSDRALRRGSLIASKRKTDVTLVHVVDAEQPDRMINAERDAAAEVMANAAATLRTQDGITADWVVQVDDVHSGIQRAAEELGADLIVIGPHRRRLSDIFVGTTAERVAGSSSYPLLIAAEPPATHYQRTLLALDFDEASKLAARQALTMGVFDHTEVIVMHAFDAPAETMMRRSMQPSSDVETYIEAEGDEAAARLRRLLAELELPPTSRTVVSMKGTAARTILEVAQNEQCDLVVLGANKRGIFERAFVGSVTADVIRDSGRDVLIIPAEQQP